MASLKLEASAASTKASQYRNELKTANANLALTKLPDNEVLVSLVAENAALRHNTAKVLKSAATAEAEAALDDNRRLKVRFT